MFEKCDFCSGYSTSCDPIVHDKWCRYYVQTKEDIAGIVKETLAQDICQIPVHPQTRRDFFAGLAMQAEVTRGNRSDPKYIAATAVALADALIAELDKSTSGS